VRGRRTCSSTRYIAIFHDESRRHMRFGAAAVAIISATSLAALSAQAQAPPPPAAKPDTPDITRTIERLKQKAGPRWASAVHFWCEEPRANRADDPPIPATKIFDDVFAIGNSGTTVYVLRTPGGLMMIDALGAGDAA